MTLQTMYPAIANSPVTQLANAIDDTVTSIEVVDGNRLPDAPNLATIGRGENPETILYTVKNGNVLSGITRGFQGTAQNWQAGTQVARLFTAHDFEVFRENILDLKSAHDAHQADYASMRFGKRPYTGRDDKDITYYIDAVNGNDNNDGLSSATAFKTWGKVQTLIPRFIGGRGIVIRIIGNLPKKIVLENILAYGRDAHRIRIMGDSSNADNHTVNGVGLYSIVGGQHYGIGLNFLTINGACEIYGCKGVRIANCKPRNNSGSGVDFIGSTGIVDSCDFGDSIVQNCIFSQWSLVASINNIGKGTQNGLRAYYTGVIGKSGTQPTGAVADEGVLAGGEIR